jgi:hypothetical protein
MTDEYPRAEQVFADGDAKIELAKQLLARATPVTEGDPAWLYLTRARRLPPDAVRGAMGELRLIEPPIPGRDQQDYACTSLIRDSDGEVSGIELAFIDCTGVAALRQPRRQTYAIKPGGVKSGLFHAGGPDTGLALLSEGYACKPLALTTAGLGRCYGGGSRTVLGCAAPPEKRVVIITDRRPDGEAGEAHDGDYKRGADLLLLEGAEVSITGDLPCTCCADADQILQRHGPIRLADWVRQAAPVGLSADGEVRKLAAVKDPLERDRLTTEVAKRLRIRVSVLREAVQYRRDSEAGEDAPLRGDDPVLDCVTPWPTPVDGHALVGAIQTYLEDHAVLPLHASLACALWTLHTHTHAAAYHSPRLALRSPTKGCGKSTLRRALSRLVPRAFEAIDITGPTLFRPIAQWYPVTVFVDEANEIDWSTARDLIAVINSGHCRDDPGVPRCVGPDFEVRLFRVWAPFCLALVGYLPPVIAERSIIIEMRKKSRSTRVRPLMRRDRDATAMQLARQAARWAVDHVIGLENAEPQVPSEMGDRPADNWHALLAIAESVGLAEKARAAAVALAAVDDDGEDRGVQLLSDIYGIFQASGATQLHSGTIVEGLLKLEGRPWPELGRNARPLTKNGMARLLRPFKIHPTGTIRIGTETSKGYLRAAFEATWLEYGIGSLKQPSQPTASAACRRFTTVTARGRCDGWKWPKRHSQPRL